MTVKLSYEIADAITLASLKDHRKYLKKELKKWEKSPADNWLHPDDVVRNKKLIDAMKILINYYGG